MNRIVQAQCPFVAQPEKAGGGEALGHGCDAKDRVGGRGRAAHGQFAQSTAMNKSTVDDHAVGQCGLRRLRMERSEQFVDCRKLVVWVHHDSSRHS